MAQPWYVDLQTAEPEAREPERKKRSAWFWIKQTGLFPFRLIGLVCAFVLLIGSFSMWVIPDLADRYKTDMMLLVLRAIDKEGPARPFRFFNPESRIDRGLIDLEPDEAVRSTEEAERSHRPGPLNDRVLDVVANKQKGGYLYVVHYASGKSKNLEAATPHLKVPRKELMEARKAVARFYSPRDKKRWQEVRAWGECLLVTTWVRRYELKVAPRDRFPGPPEGTEEEQIWCVWQALRSGGPEEDLERLPELFRQSFPQKQEQEAALAWADNLHQRLERSFLYAHKAFYVGSNPSLGDNLALQKLYSSFKQVLPPEKGWTRLWLLQQYVGLSPAAREAARQRWLSYFPAAKHDQVVALGTSLARQRQEQGEPLPQAPEVLPVLCVIERLLGTDAEGGAAYDALARVPDQRALALTLTVAYPNDDLMYLAGSGNRLGLHPYAGEGQGEVYNVVFAVFILGMTWLSGLGIQTGLRWFLVPLVLSKKTRALWDKHEEGRGDESFLLSILSVLVFAGIGFLLAPYSLSELVLVQVGSPLQLFFGAVIATAVGGLLISTVRRLAALFLIACGVDIEETWADEILGIIGGAFVLFHFGNDWIAIVLFILSDLGPGLVTLAWHRLRSRRTAPAPVPALSYP